MTELALYTAVALLTLIVVALLVRQNQSHEPAAREQHLIEDFSDDSWLSLAERIFDPADCLWLRDELGFPALAKTLARSRQQMALRWLRAARLSFEALLRLPEPLAAGGSVPGGSPPSWRLLWMTLRLHGLLAYATLVARLFGPYHRLVPSLRWLPTLAPSDSRKPDYHASGTDPII